MNEEQGEAKLEIDLTHLDVRERNRIARVPAIDVAWFLPEFSISASMPAGYCTRVNYTVTMTPAPVRPSTGDVWVEVVISELATSGDRDRARHLILFPPSGGTRSGSAEWEIPDDSGPWHPDWTNSVRVTVNPSGLNHVPERNPSNNSVVVFGTCVG